MRKTVRSSKELSLTVRLACCMQQGTGVKTTPRERMTTTTRSELFLKETCVEMLSSTRFGRRQHVLSPLVSVRREIWAQRQHVQCEQYSCRWRANRKHLHGSNLGASSDMDEMKALHGRWRKTYHPTIPCDLRIEQLSLKRYGRGARVAPLFPCRHPRRAGRLGRDQRRATEASASSTQKNPFNCLLPEHANGCFKRHISSLLAQRLDGCP